MLCYDAHYFGSYTRAISDVLTTNLHSSIHCGLIFKFIYLFLVGNCSEGYGGGCVTAEINRKFHQGMYDLQHRAQFFMTVF